MDHATYVSDLQARYAISAPVIATVVEQATGRRVTAAERLIMGDENEVHRVRLADDSVVYLRVGWPGQSVTRTRDQAWAMEQARAAGVPAPEVLALPVIDSADGERAGMVLREVPGRPLAEVLPPLSAAARSSALAGFGRTLRTLHAVAMPGDGRPDDHGRWGDPVTGLRRYLDDVREDTRHLPAAGLTDAEVRRVHELLDRPVVPPESPVLCHGDLGWEHVFVDDGLRVVGLIDWGQWSAGPATSDLADLTLRHPTADRDAVLSGYGSGADRAARDELCWHVITRATGQLRWLVVSGQTDELSKPARAIRDALSMINS